MQVKVEIVGPESNIPPADRKNITVDIHERRVDTFNVMKSHTVLEGDAAQVFSVPPGGRLVVTTPEATEQAVYDREQGASIAPSAQANAGGRADRASDNVRQPPPSPSRILPAGAPGVPQSPQPRVQTAQQPFVPPGGTPPPAGEKPPLPGTPASSPPTGNKGP